MLTGLQYSKENLLFNMIYLFMLQIFPVLLLNIYKITEIVVLLILRKVSRILVELAVHMLKF